MRGEGLDGKRFTPLGAHDFSQSHARACLEGGAGWEVRNAQIFICILPCVSTSLFASCPLTAQLFHHPQTFLMQSWHYSLNGQQLGPVTEDQLRQLVAQGQVNATTLIWNPSLTGWIPLAQALPELALVQPLSLPPPLPSLQPRNKKKGWIKKILITLLILVLLSPLGLIGYRYYEHLQAVDNAPGSLRQVGMARSVLPDKVNGLYLNSVAAFPHQGNSLMGMAMGFYGELIGFDNFQLRGEGANIIILQHATHAAAEADIRTAQDYTTLIPQGDLIESQYRSGETQNFRWTAGSLSFRCAASSIEWERTKLLSFVNAYRSAFRAD